MNALRRRLLDRLKKLPLESTICPGQLTRDCGTTLAQARPDLLALAREEKITLSQRGKTIAGDEIKGPFRVRLSRQPPLSLAAVGAQ